MKMHWYLTPFSTHIIFKGISALSLGYYKLSPSIFSLEVKISWKWIGDSASMEMLGLISINAKANVMNKLLIINLYH